MENKETPKAISDTPLFAYTISAFVFSQERLSLKRTDTVNFMLVDANAL